MKTQVKKHNLGYKMSGDMRMHGGAWYDDIWQGIKTVAGPINSVLKSTGIIGNLASAYNPTAGVVVKSAGYGKKRKMKGRGASSESNAIMKC